MLLAFARQNLAGGGSPVGLLLSLTFAGDQPAQTITSGQANQVIGAGIGFDLVIDNSGIFIIDAANSDVIVPNVVNGITQIATATRETVAATVEIDAAFTDNIGPIIQDAASWVSIGGIVNTGGGSPLGMLLVLTKSSEDDDLTLIVAGGLATSIGEVESITRAYTSRLVKRLKVAVAGNKGGTIVYRYKTLR